MHLYLDESGSFLPGVTHADAWCIVAAYVVPEPQRRPAEEALRQLKRRLGRPTSQEVKLRDIGDEGHYLAFLQDLAPLGGTLYATAVDCHRNRMGAVVHHLARQTEALQENLPKARDPASRAEFEARAQRFARLSPQLYLQLVCQYQLLALILRQALPYYALRQPAALGRFRWRIDRKNAANSIFDSALEHYAGPMLQSLSFSEPSVLIRGADYSHFRRFWFHHGAPTYLRDTYGLEVGEGFNVALVMHEDLAFVDSAEHVGVQLADLLASGLRRCLRGEFGDNRVAAAALGRLMVARPGREPPLELISLDGGEALDRQSPADAAIRLMMRTCRQMLPRKV